MIGRMNKKKIWTKTPRAFIFLVCRLIYDNNGSFCHEDLLDFLGAETKDVTLFLKNPEVIPIKWLTKIGETPEGNDLLAQFNSLPKIIIEGDEYCLIPDDSNCAREEAARQLLLGGDLCDFPENDFPVFFLDEARELLFDNGSRLNSLGIKKEKTIDSPDYSDDKKREEFIKPEKNGNEGEKIVAKEIKKLVIGKKRRTRKKQERKIVADPIEQFITGLYRIAGLRDERGLNMVFGAEKISQFRINRTVPCQWVEVLMKHDGGEAHLERFKSVLKIASKKGGKKELKPVSIVEEQKSSQEIIQPVQISIEESPLKAEPEIQIAQEKLVSEVEVTPEGEPTTRIEEAVEVKSNAVAEIESTSQEVVAVEVKLEESSGEVLKPSSEPVTKEIPSLEVKKTSQILPAKRSNGKKKVLNGKSDSDLNGFKSIPRLEVLSVLMCMQEIITGKKVVQASDLDVDCIAKELKVPSKDITTMRKGGIPMHTGHLQVVKKKYGSKSDLLRRWE